MGRSCFFVNTLPTPVKLIVAANLVLHAIFYFCDESATFWWPPSLLKIPTVFPVIVCGSIVDIKRYFKAIHCNNEKTKKNNSPFHGCKQSLVDINHSYNY